MAHSAAQGLVLVTVDLHIMVSRDALLGANVCTTHAMHDMQSLCAGGLGLANTPCSSIFETTRLSCFQFVELVPRLALSLCDIDCGGRVTRSDLSPLCQWARRKEIMHVHQPCDNWALVR